MKGFPRFVPAVWFVLLGIVSSLTWIGSAGATVDRELNRVVAGVRKTYGEAQDFRAEFTQEVFLRAAGIQHKSRGTVYLRKPDGMRWETREPSQQIYVINGRVAWQYDAETRQATKQRLPEDPGGTPASFLRDMGRLGDDFQVAFALVSSPTNPKGHYLLRLTPKRSMAGLKKLLLEVEPRSFRVVRFTLHDATGNVTTVRFARIRFNTNLPDHLFQFNPPPGIEVLELP